MFRSLKTLQCHSVGYYGQVKKFFLSSLELKSCNALVVVRQSLEDVGDAVTVQRLGGSWNVTHHSNAIIAWRGAHPTFLERFQPRTSNM